MSSVTHSTQAHAAAPTRTSTEAKSDTNTSELARARAIAQRLGITNLTDDEYDVPTYMRRSGTSADSDV
jgi:hypothetical protein